jgi:RimJ/RimL family protein N-acetyltransferase
MPIIKGKGFVLRPLTVTDAKGYMECHQDKEAQQNFTSAPKTIAEAKKEISKNLKKQKAFAIEVDGKFAGFIHLELTDHPRYKHSAIIGYGIHKDFRGRGLATAAAKLMTVYGFKTLKLRRIVGYCRTFNKASARVLEKSGYKLEGILKKNKFVKGKFLDDMVWAKVR